MTVGVLHKTKYANSGLYSAFRPLSKRQGAVGTRTWFVQYYPLCSDSGGLYPLYRYAQTNQFSPPHCHYDERQRGDNLEHKSTNSIFAFLDYHDRYAAVS